MILTLFKTKHFYFSNEYDLTNCFQKFIKNQCDVNLYNSNFCYNECHFEDFLKIGAFEWICPFISGFVSVINATIKDY